MKTITKKQIIEKTRGTSISNSSAKNYTCQLEMHKNYTKDIDGNVLFNYGANSNRIGFATTKNEFITLVYSHINSAK